jgi:DNA-binding NarL/FixJ family response regulator
MLSRPHARAHVLSIRDNAADEKLIEIAWRSDPEIELTHVRCGVEALEYLRKENRKLPNLILLAWRFQANQRSALETLVALKADAILRRVPVVVLAGPLSPQDIEGLYDNQVACVLEFAITGQPGGLEYSLRLIKELWLNRARLPHEQQLVYRTEPEVTEREKQIIRLIAQDLPSKEIGFRLGISPKTVEFHRQRIRNRIGVRGTAGIVRYAVDRGILSE